MGWARLTAQRNPQTLSSHWPCFKECRPTDASHKAAVHPLPNNHRPTHLHVPAACTMLSGEKWKSFARLPRTVNNESGTSSLIMALIIYNGFRYDKKTSAGGEMPSFPILISMDLAASTLNREIMALSLRDLPHFPRKWPLEQTHHLRLTDELCIVSDSQLDLSSSRARGPLIWMTLTRSLSWRLRAFFR